MKWQTMPRNVIAHPKPCASRVVHLLTGNRDVLHKRTHYHSYAAGSYNFIHKRSASSCSFALLYSSRAFAFSRRVYRNQPGVPGPTLVGFLYFSFILVSVAPKHRAEDSASRGALAGDCYVRKKPSRARSVDNLNYISHHNPREPVKPTPAFCSGAPRVGSSEWAPACHAEVTLPALSLFVPAPLASTFRLTPVLLRFVLSFRPLHRLR